MPQIETVIVRGNRSKPSPEPVNVVLDTLYDEIGAIENATKQKLEDRIASLEKAKYALCYSSGIAAITSISMLLEHGEHAVLFDSVYHGTRTYLNIKESLGTAETTFVDLRDASRLEKHMRENTKMVWIETPCNPTMKIVDIAAVAEIVKRHGQAFLVVDNTFMSPYFQNPLLLGADIVMHSLTKYINGHSDVCMGAAAMNTEELYLKLKKRSKHIGSLPSPMDCFLCLRGLRTLHLRMQRHMENAMQIALFLEKHPNVEKVYYPGLRSHPQYELILKQCRGFSGMISFCVKGGLPAARSFAARIKIFTLAVSLGTTESLADISALMTAHPLTQAQREELEISENLIRLSVGLEDVKDLIEDLNQALLGVCQSD